MIYKIRWEMAALRAWRKLEARVALVILHDITDLCAGPYPAASTALVDGGAMRRLRVGDHRVIYEISGELVTVYEIGHRNEIYKEVLDIEGIGVPVATARMLYEMKRDTVRPQDRADADVLRRRFRIEE